MPTPSPQRNSPFPRSALASSSSATSSSTKKVTFETSLPPISPHTTPKKQFAANLLFPTRSPSSSSLPDPLHDLFRLHTALSTTLTVHLATKPPHAPERTADNKRRNPHGYEAEEVVFEGVANYEGQSGLRELVENGAGLKFPLDQLRRLAWLYDWDGKTLPPSTNTSRTLTPGRVGTSSPSKPSTTTSLMSLSLSPTRTLSKASREPMQTYAFNLTIPHSPLVGGVVGALGKWSAQQGERSVEVLRRLECWASLCRDEQHASAHEEADQLLFAKVRRTIPMKALPPLAGARGALDGAILLGPASARTVSLANAPSSTLRRNVLSSAPGLGSPSPSRVLSFGGPAAGEAPATPPATPTKGSSVAAKRQSMRERMLAKEAASSSSSNNGTFLQTPVGLGDAFIDASAQTGRNASTRRLISSPAELRRKSILSRLANVAEGVFL